MRLAESATATTGAFWLRLSMNPTIIVTLLPMRPHMLSRVNNLEVLRTIVRLVMVPMMDLLVTFKWAPKHLLSNNLMLIALTPAMVDANITTRVGPRHPLNMVCRAR
jgi:hypothetical protein